MCTIDSNISIYRITMYLQMYTRPLEIKFLWAKFAFSNWGTSPGFKGSCEVTSGPR